MIQPRLAGCKWCWSFMCSLWSCCLLRILSCCQQVVGADRFIAPESSGGISCSWRFDLLAEGRESFNASCPQFGNDSIRNNGGIRISWGQEQQPSRGMPKSAYLTKFQHIMAWEFSLGRCVSHGMHTGTFVKQTISLLQGICPKNWRTWAASTFRLELIPVRMR